MAARRAALLVLALVLAGCLQEPPPPEAAAGEETLLDVLPVPEPEPQPELPTPMPPTVEPVNGSRVEPPVTPPPDPEGEARVLLRAERANATNPMLLDVPEGALRVRLVLDVEGARWNGVVELKAPDGATMAACLAAPCEAFVDGPVASGNWSLHFPPGAPVGLLATVMAIMEERAPTPVATPPPVEGTQHLVYARSRDFADSPLNRTHTDAFAVAPGYDRLVVKAHAAQPTAAGQVRMLLLDPAWKLHGSCDASAERCVLEAPSPMAGLWRINYTGEARVRANVTAYGLAVADVPMPANLSVQDTGHAYTLQPGGNASAGFYVVGGYGRVALDVSFHHPLPVTSEDRPRVILYDPTGRAWLCEPGAGSPCPREAPAVEGRWYVYYLGPASGTVSVRAHLYPGAPQPDPEPGEPSTPTGATQLYMRDIRTSDAPTNHTDFINIHSTAARLTGFLYLRPEASPNGTTQAIRIYNPGGELAFECAGAASRTCPVDLPTTWSGRWQVHFTGEGRGYVRASLNHSDEAGYTPQAGHHHTAYDNTHSWHSWASRGPFSEGFTVLPGWSRVNVTIEFVKVAADDGKSTASIEIRAPDGSAAKVCTRANNNRNCTFETPARDGLWEVAYKGQDVSSHSRVTVRVSA